MTIGMAFSTRNEYGGLGAAVSPETQAQPEMVPSTTQQ